MRHRFVAVSGLLLALLLGPRLEGQGPPHEIPKLRWTSAARALDHELSDLVHPNSRRLLIEQSEKFRTIYGSAAEHGLREGHLAPEKFCTVKGIGESVFFRGPDSRGEFGSGLRLAEVAVVATVTGITPGFAGSAWIESLLELGDAVPLHDRSPVPDYALVPVQRVVAEDRVFCGGYGVEFDPVVGTRVVIIGPWVQGVVPVGPGPGHSSLFATVEKDGESLDWSHGSTGPSTLVDLEARVDEAISGNLYLLTRDLIQLEEGAKKRRKFAVEWSRRTRRGCRLVAVDAAGEEQTEICIDPKATAAARERFEKAWQQQCADGGQEPFAEVLSELGRTTKAICER